MGVKFDRMLDGFDGPFEKLNGLQKPAPGKVTTTATARLYLQPCRQRRVHRDQRLLAAGEDVSWMSSGPQQGDILRRHEGVDRGDRRQARGRSRRQLRRRARAARRRAIKLRKLADRAGRSVRRVDALGLDALAARAVRVPVRGRLPAGARRGQPDEPLRRDHPSLRRRAGARRGRPRRRGGGAGGGGGRGGGAGARRTFRASIRASSAPTRRRRPRRSSRSSSRTAARSWRSDVRR